MCHVADKYMEVLHPCGNNFIRDLSTDSISSSLVSDNQSVCNASIITPNSSSSTPSTRPPSRCAVTQSQPAADRSPECDLEMQQHTNIVPGPCERVTEGEQAS